MIFQIKISTIIASVETGGEGVRKASYNVLGGRDNCVGNMDDSIKSPIKNKLNMVKEQVETDILHFTEKALEE